MPMVFDYVEECRKHQGRTLMLQFECGRCGKKHTEPFESFKVPEGWREHERNMPLLCPECHKAFNEFMKGGDQKCCI